MEVKVFKCPYRENLCTTCVKDFDTCEGDNVEFGSAIGGSNVIQCDQYTPEEVLPPGVISDTIDKYDV